MNWPDSIVFDAPVEIIGFCDNTFLPTKYTGQILNDQKAITNIEDDDSYMRTFDNCFRVSNFIGDGSSGGAITHDGYCIGMIVFGKPLCIKSLGETVALKSSHISSLLKQITNR